MSRDEILADGIKRGDENSIREFVEVYARRLWVFLMRFGLLASDVQEVLVSTISDVVLKIHDYEPRSETSFRNWVYTLARHEMSDWLRRKPRLIQDETTVDELAAPEKKEVVPSKEKKEMQEALDGAFKQLSDREQMCVYMRMLAEPYTYNEIGEELSISEVNARVIFSRAMEKLRKTAPLLLEEERQRRRDQ